MIMKRFLLLVACGALFSSFAVNSSIDEVIAAMKTGNVSQIAKYFDNTVEITMPDKNNSYSKSQAEMVLRDFFSTNGVKGFTVIHKGENGGSKYCIGTLTTQNGSYRTTIFMKLKSDKQYLQEIRFESN